MGHIGVQRHLLHLVAGVCQVAGGHLSVQLGAGKSAGRGLVDGGFELPDGVHRGQDFPGALADVPHCGGGSAYGHRVAGRPAGRLLRQRFPGREPADKESVSSNRQMKNRQIAK